MPSINLSEPAAVSAGLRPLVGRSALCREETGDAERTEITGALLPQGFNLSSIQGFTSRSGIYANSSQVSLAVEAVG